MATIDHADIRGLVTAFHLSVAGLPHSSVGDHRVNAHVTRSRIPLIGPAHRVAPPVAVWLYDAGLLDLRVFELSVSS